MYYLKPMTAFLRIGWKLYAHKQSPFNAAMSYALANAITGTYPDFGINPSKVLVSRGALATAINATANDTGGNIELMWDDNSGTSSAKATDKTLVVILNETKGEIITDTSGAERVESVQNIAMPANWSGDDLHVYLGFVSEDGREVANSVYFSV